MWMRNTWTRRSIACRWWDGRRWRARRSGQDGRDRRERRDGPEERDRLPFPPLLPYFFVDEVGFGGGLSTYSLRNHEVAPFRAIFTSTWRRRFVASGFFE